MNNIREELFNARRLYKNGNYTEALKIYEKHYEKHPEVFHIGFKTSYAWAIFKTSILNPESEEELLKSAQMITQLTNQSDLNKNSSCVYTFAVLNVMKYLRKEAEFYEILDWIERLNPDLLDENKQSSGGISWPSNKELYFEIASKAYLNTREYEECIEISERALKSVNDFNNFGDVWHKWRIAKSLRQLNRPKEALDYLEEVIKIKDEWYIFKEMAEIYFSLGKSNEALKYLCPAVLSKKPLSVKVNLYYLIYRILDSIHSPLALMHAQLYYLLKLESGAQVNENIKRLNIDETELNKKELNREITKVWMKYRFRDCKLHHGTVVKFIAEKNYGFIRDENDESIFFHKDEFVGANVYQGQLVSFYTEESFDKTKMRKSIKAVNVRGE